MDKKALLEYALFARKELEKQISISLNNIGIFKDHIANANIVGDMTIIEGNNTNFPKTIYDQRLKIINQFIKPDGFDNVVEELAYTWFNRIIALRFLEIHGYLTHGFRILSSKDGSYEPDALKNIHLVKFDLNLDDSIIHSFQEKNDFEGLYRYLLFSQCNALSDSLPMLFNKQESFMELMLPANLLNENSVIKKISIIPEDDFKNDVEVIGWLYQFYVSSSREQFRKAKKVTKELVPTLTQVFTPDWIVRYMAQNSIGRLWLESYPDSPLKSQMKYYVPDAKQTSEIQKKIDEIKYKNVDPKTIKIIEPCCGSGHILVYVFDLLYEMYLEKGYLSQDIPALILKNNLFGLDVDKRAAQLSQFALMMKARSIDKKFFNKDRIVFPNVYEIIDSQYLLTLKFHEILKEMKFDSNIINTINYLVDTFRNGKVIGSLLKVENRHFKHVKEELIAWTKKNFPNLVEQEFVQYGIPLLVKLCDLAAVLSSKYDVMITNPPYLGNSKLEEACKIYTEKEYPDSKSDMFAMFMETNFVKKNGFMAIVNPDSWMFLISFKELRKKIIFNKYIINMIHLGMGAFDAVVQTTSCVIRNSPIDTNGTYFRLVDSKDKKSDFLKNIGGGYKIDMLIFNKVVNNIFFYWLSKPMLNVFINSKSLSFFADAKQGTATAKNNLFLRMWFEISFYRIGFNCTDKINAFATGKKWFPYNKGGAYRKWYGNNDYVINWENNGEAVLNYKDNTGKQLSVVRNTKYYFQECISWSDVSSSRPSFRFKTTGFIFDASGPSIFMKDDFTKNEKYLLGVLNTSLVAQILKVLAPSLHFSVGHVSAIPIFNPTVNTTISEETSDLAKENIEQSKKDWDSFETSWDFKKHPLI